MLGSVLFYVVIAVLIFGVLIATHELGHFATAKLLGVKVNLQCWVKVREDWRDNEQLLNSLGFAKP